MEVKNIYVCVVASTSTLACSRSQGVTRLVCEREREGERLAQLDDKNCWRMMTSNSNGRLVLAITWRIYSAGEFLGIYWLCLESRNACIEAYFRWIRRYVGWLDFHLRSWGWVYMFCLGFCSFCRCLLFLNSGPGSHICSAVLHPHSSLEPKPNPSVVVDLNSIPSPARTYVSPCYLAYDDTWRRCLRIWLLTR